MTRFANGILLAAPLALLVAAGGRAEEREDGWIRQDPAAPAAGGSGSRASGMDDGEFRQRAPGTRSRAEELYERFEKDGKGPGVQRPAAAKRKDAPARAKELPGKRRDALKESEDDPGKPRDAASRRLEFLGNSKEAAKPKAPAQPKDPPARPKAAPPAPKPPPAPAATGKPAQIKELEDQLVRLRKSKAPPHQIQQVELRLANLRRDAAPPVAGAKARKY